MPKKDGLCIESLEYELGNLSIAPSKHKCSQLEILDVLCQEHVKKLDLDSATGASSLEDQTTICLGILDSMVSDAVKISNEDDIERNLDIVIHQMSMLMIKNLISMLECLIDRSDRIPVTLLSVIYDNQICVVSTMLKSEWGEKLPDTWNVFKEVLQKKHEFLATSMKSKMSHAESMIFLDSLHGYMQFQREIFCTCVSISVGYEIVMPAIKDAWQTLFDLERYVLEKITIEEEL